MKGIIKRGKDKANGTEFTIKDRSEEPSKLKKTVNLKKFKKVIYLFLTGRLST